jgi:hypothetical protein
MSPGNSSKYNRDYYKRNKKKILASRAKRYKTDGSYRSGILNRAEAGRVLRRAANKMFHSTVEHDKVEERTYTFTELSETISREKSVIYRWRWQGAMPRPIYFEGTQKCLGIYSQSQVALMSAFCKMVDNGERVTYQEMAFVLHKLWKKRFDPGAFAKCLQQAKRKLKGERSGKAVRAVKKESTGKKESGRKTRNKVGRVRRVSAPKTNKGVPVRRRRSNSSDKSRRDSEHGELRKPSHRRGFIRSM